MEYRYVVFDFDGTLADSQGVMDALLLGYMEEYGVGNVSLEALKRPGQLPFLRKLQLLFVLRPVLSRFHQEYGERLGEISPFAGMLSLLGELREAGYRVAVLSSNTEDNIRRYLSGREAPEGMPVVASKGIGGKNKSLREFARREGCPLKELLYVGDELRDIKACNAAGVDMVFVTWGMDGEEVCAGREVRMVARSPGELRSFLLGLPGPV